MAELKKRTYTSAFEGQRTLGRLLAPEGFTWEIELPIKSRDVPLILHISCNAILTSFIAYIAQQILQQLQLDFVILGGPENCCGSIHKNLGDSDLQEEVATKSLLGFRRAHPKTVLSICPDCDHVFAKYRIPDQGFRHANISALLVEHIDALREKMRPVNRRVVIHRHDVDELRMGDANRIEMLLNAIPGLKILPAKYAHPASIHCHTVHPMAPEDQARMFSEARELGADALVVPYHSCYRQHVKMQLKYGIETQHYFGLLAMSLGISFEEPFKQLRLLDNIDSVMSALHPKIKSMGYEEEVVKSYVERSIFC